LNQILDNRELYLLFRAFLKQQRCEENLNFYIEIELLKMETDQHRITEKIHAIYERYFGDEAINPVNVDIEIQQELQKSMQKQVLKASIYDHAQKSLCQLLVDSCVSKFITSDFYLEYKELHSSQNKEKPSKFSVLTHTVRIKPTRKTVDIAQTQETQEIINYERYLILKQKYKLKEQGMNTSVSMDSYSLKCKETTL